MHLDAGNKLLGEQCAVGVVGSVTLRSRGHICCLTNWRTFAALRTGIVCGIDNELCVEVSRLGAIISGVMTLQHVDLVKPVTMNVLSSVKTSFQTLSRRDKKLFFPTGSLCSISNS